MPFPGDTKSALVWELEALYLALSENLMESLPLSGGHVERCLGSSRYTIFCETLPTEIGPSSGLATLYLESPMESRSFCNTEVIIISIIEQVTNLGFGIWHVTSASVKLNFRETLALSTNENNILCKLSHLADYT